MTVGSLILVKQVQRLTGTPANPSISPERLLFLIALSQFLPGGHNSPVFSQFTANFHTFRPPF